MCLHHPPSRPNLVHDTTRRSSIRKEKALRTRKAHGAHNRVMMCKTSTNKNNDPSAEGARTRAACNSGMVLSIEPLHLKRSTRNSLPFTYSLTFTRSIPPLPYHLGGQVTDRRDSISSIIQRVFGCSGTSSDCLQ